MWMNFTEYFMSLVDTMSTSKHHVMSWRLPHPSTHTHASVRTHMRIVKHDVNTHDFKPHIMTVCPFGELSVVLKSSRTKKHILHLSCRHPEGEVGGVLRRDTLPEDLHASSARPISCSDELILIWRSYLIGRAAVRDSHLNDWVKNSLIWKLLTGHIFLPRHRHFSFGLSAQLTDRCY